MPKKQTTPDNQFKHVTSPETLDSEQMVDIISEALLERKAEDISVLDVRGLTTLTDFFVVCHATTDIQIKAIANNVIEKVREELNETAWKKEGMDSRRWVVLDFVNVVVHIFNKEQREYYSFERMWNDAEVTKVEDEVE